MKLQIVLSEWDRGLRNREQKTLSQIDWDGAETKLLSQYGMCCLGFLAKACGYKDNEIEGMSFIDELPQAFERFPKGFIGQHCVSDTTMLIARVNDAVVANTPLSKNLTESLFSSYNLDHYKERVISSEEFRHKRLTELFAELGVELEFVP